jgi:hypothetical protein
MRKINMHKQKENKINTITPRFIHGNLVKGKTMVGVNPQYYTLQKYSIKFIWGILMHSGSLPRSLAQKKEVLQPQEDSLSLQ